jgi:hypothetical protein
MGQCYRCGSDEHLLRDCPQKCEVKEDNDEDKGVFPAALAIPGVIQGRTGYNVLIDSDASHTFISPNITTMLGTKVHKYRTGRKLKLGMKGSKVSIEAYCFLQFQDAGVDKQQQFEITNIEGDVTLGRDFLQAHSVEANEFKQQTLKMHLFL